ncbi:hypothetical protein [Mucilaginibacter jinjuensis]|uniref:Adhesin domain-containing protein n=1 Tax=Mucilaginibacter jinjuensis TaxID=1176721 RepID=A0ABY7T8P7_9SPHI|nr:hypothetical protein [Mucilaginibacter jinjuensis]WCT12634.1 hypothetical protein PQO05_01655 [Mucilaginibacter jinjuensis]
MKTLKKVVLAALCLFAANGTFAQQKGDTSSTVSETPAASGSGTDTTATNYREKMRNLQEQMRNVQRQMNDLRAQQSKLNMEHVQAMGDKINDRSFSIGGSDENGHRTYMRGDDYIAKKIASGEVKEKTKPYTKSYTISATDKIAIDNQFGKVNVNTWAKNEVKVDVEIKADGDNDTEAQKILDRVTIKDGKEGEGVSFKTDIEKTGEENNWGSWDDDGKSHVRRVVVNYTVYMPAKNALSISNRFGEVTVPDLSGKLSLDVKFGNLTAKDLSNPMNEINVKFGDATIANLNSDEFNISYGTAKIGTADKLKAKVSFAGLDVDKLTSSGDITLKYTRGGTGFKVGELDKNLKSLNIDASFSKVVLNPKDNFDFDISTKMGGFNYDDSAVSVTNTTPTDGERKYYNPNKTYKGHAGKGGSAKTVTIKSNFTSIKFDQ